MTVNEYFKKYPSDYVLIEDGGCLNKDEWQEFCKSEGSEVLDYNVYIPKQIPLPKFDYFGIEEMLENEGYNSEYFSVSADLLEDLDAVLAKHIEPQFEAGEPLEVDE